MDVLKFYDIDKKVHHILSDNAANMIKCKYNLFLIFFLTLTFILAIRDFNELLNEEVETDGQDEAAGADDEGGEEETLKQLESLTDSAEIAVVKRRVEEIEAEMKKSPQGQDPVTKAFRLPCTAHKVCSCHFI